MNKFGRLLLPDLDGLIVCLVLGSWEFLTKTPLTIRTALTLVGFYFVLRALAALRKMRESGVTTVTPKEKESKRVFVDHPEAVVALAELTSHEYVTRSAPYIGKWITISGRYEGIADSLSGDFIHLSLLLRDGRRVNLRFAEDGRERLRGLRVGQRITTVGQIPNFGTTFMPENCELVHAEPSGRADRSTLAYVS